MASQGHTTRAGFGVAPRPSHPGSPKDTDGKDVDAVHGVFVVVGVGGAVAAENHLPLQRHLCLHRDRRVTPSPKSPPERGVEPRPAHSHPPS